MTTPTPTGSKYFRTASTRRSKTRRERRKNNSAARWAGRCAAVLLACTVLPVLLLRWLPPPTSALMITTRLAGIFDNTDRPAVQHRWTPWEKISPAMRLAVVAAEDQKFPDHSGFDLVSLNSAVRAHQAGKRLRGASTISQQVAKNLFLWPGRSFVRKGIEAYFTVLLEVFWPKRRILEVYLNIVELGEQVFGVHAAAEAYFRKKPAALTSREAALLAATLPNPHVLRAARPSAYVLERSRWIETQMRQLGADYLGGL